MLVEFERHGSKFYAATPTGEWAFGDAGGLYEWRDGQLIHYTGGDRQAVYLGEWLRYMNNPETFIRGIQAAVMPYRYLTN